MWPQSHKSSVKISNTVIQSSYRASHNQLFTSMCVCVCSVVTIKDGEEQQKSSGRDIGGTKLTLHDRSHPQVLVSAPLTGFKSVLWRENKANL